MIGQTISHYKVLEKIGQGGMGEVYLAEDTSLDRKVALKFLPEHLHSDEVAHKRFIREAKSAAALDHPFICHIHEVGEVEGKNFISMEYVEGETLRDRLAREPLTYRETLRMGSEIAEALQRAHEAGIVHRDLKPSNIMLTKEGRVKVMDFGLAKRVVVQDVGEQETTAALTKEGTTLGTVPYMSPEQLRGEEVDARSDIFSFGILLYEMLLGKHPFQRSTPTQTAAAILEAEPDFPSGSQAGPGGTLNEVLLGMLTKDRQGRTQAVEQVRQTVEALLEQVTPSPTPRWLLWAAGLALAALVSVGAYHLFQLLTAPSLAVLTFATQGDHPDLETLANGIPETVIQRLSPVMYVTASTSSFRLGTDIDPKEVADRLKIRFVLVGTVNAREEAFRVSANLIDTTEDRAIWGNRYDWTLEDVVLNEEVIATEIAQALKIKLTEAEVAQLARSDTDNIEAYLAYQEGRRVYKTLDRFQAALGHFEAAIAADLDYAPAYAGISIVYGTLALWAGGLPVSEAVPAIQKNAAKALELDPTLAEAYCAVGQQKVLQWDWAGAEEAFRQAIKLNPSLPDGYRSLAMYFLLPTGKFEAAITQLEKALELDPLTPWISLNLGMVHLVAGSTDEAIGYFRKVRELDPDFWLTYYFLGWSYVSKGMIPEARSEFARVEEDCPGCLPPFETPSILWFLGEKEEAYRALEDIPREGKRSYEQAVLFTHQGQKDEAFQTLARIIDDPDRIVDYSIILMKVDPTWDPLRDDPRFEDLLRRMGLEP